MLKAIKIRLYPDDEQVTFINKQLGCRLVYNQCIEHKKESYEIHNISASSVVQLLIEIITLL